MYNATTRSRTWGPSKGFGLAIRCNTVMRCGHHILPTAIPLPELRKKRRAGKLIIFQMQCGQII